MFLIALWLNSMIQHEAPPTTSVSVTDNARIIRIDDNHFLFLSRRTQPNQAAGSMAPNIALEREKATLCYLEINQMKRRNKNAQRHRQLSSSR
jgi:hypothetical protein